MRLLNRLPIARWLPELREPGAARADLFAGLTGAIVVLPQGVAFATLAGMPPEYGLYGAMVPCVVAALFGSSRLMVTGPATAISLTTLALMAPLATLSSLGAIGHALPPMSLVPATAMVRLLSTEQLHATQAHLIFRMQDLRLERREARATDW